MAETLIATQRLADPRNPSRLSPRGKRGVAAQVQELLPLWRQSVAHAQEMEAWYRNELATTDVPVLPNKAGADLRALRDEAATPWAKMIADGLSQDLIVESIRQQSDGKNAPAYRLWQQNGLDARQKPVHDGAIRHGKAFNLVAPAVTRLGPDKGKPTAYVRGKSALTSDAFFLDDFDEYPACFLEGVEQVNDDGTRVLRIDFWDDTSHYLLSAESDDDVRYIDDFPHDMDLCPVVRLAENIDLTGRVMGEIEPYIRLFKRINQSTMDRLVVQRFGAFVVRWIAGIEEPETDELKRAAAIALSMTDLLVSPDQETKFGSLPATPLDGYIRSREADIRDLSATSMTPSFHMLGLSDNVGAEGLAAAEAAHMRKIGLSKISKGEFWETSMRLGGHAAGDQAIAEDFESRAHWKDTSSQSFQSFAQGLGTLVQQVGIPPEILWPRVLEQPDIEKATKLAKQMAAQAQADAALAAVQEEDARAAAARTPAAG